MRHLTNLRSGGLTAALVAAGLAVCLTANAMAAGIAFEISAGDAATALKQFAAQAHVQLLFDYKAIAALRTPAVRGEYEAADALRVLLRGTGFTFRQVNDHTIAVLAPGSEVAPSAPSSTQSSSPSTGAGQKEGESNSSGGFRLAQADQEQAQGSLSLGRNTKPSDQNPAKLEEVVVTAEKREERLQNVPISISVLSGTQLESPTIASIADALATVPAVAINQDYTGAGPVVTIRGVGIGQTVFAGTSPVAYYIDNAPFGLVRSAVAPDQDAYDLQRIEVLRGPQGTLYGASALNGVVRILTNDPDLNLFDVKIRASDSYTDGGSNNYQGDMAVNVPLIDGKLGARAVLGYESDSGWIDSVFKKDMNDVELRNFRLKLRAQPTDDLSIGLSYWGTRDHWGGLPTGDDNYKNPSYYNQPIETDFDAYSLRVVDNFSGYSLSSTTSYLNFMNDSNADFTELLGFPFLLYTGLGSKVASEEVLLNSPSEGNWRWSLGGMYRWGRESLYQDEPLLGPANGFFEQEDDTSKSYAGYGELTRLFLDGRLEATAGLRQFEDNVNQNGRLFPTDPYIPSDGRFHATTPRAVLTWHATNEVTVYGSYSQGFRSGFPQDVADPRNIGPVNADKLYNYELGTKGTLWDGNLSFDLAAYYMDWQHVQQTLQVPYQNIYVTAVINGQSASGTGVDASLTTRPVKGLILGVSASWNNLEADSDIYSSGVVLFHKGDRLNYSPETTASGSGAYEFPIGGQGLLGRVAASTSYTSAQRYVVNPGGPVVIVGDGDPIVIGRVALAIESPAHWVATLFVENVNNDRGAVTRPLLTAEETVRVRPRTGGLQFEYHFR